mmetsp:Transcript_61068/g.137871  ORF Transcript_61068/g.137871 Transcript_61068/m.137871 type:complete len:1000 (-) Transcript_61068:101-3100(-)
MSTLFGLFGRSSDAKTSNKPYSIDHLHKLYDRLTILQESEEREIMVEVIRQITEALIWGEQNDPDRTFFDFFCEKKILAYFVMLLQPARDLPKTVQVQLLQTLSMLVQNIHRDTSLYYLFSNNYVNQLISTQLECSDEEILGYYISFLKSLALRLNNETIKFFFLNERLGAFPLYVEGVRFFAHNDNMVRTAVRTLTLQVYSIEDRAMRRFVLEMSSQTYFIHIACYLRELWYQLDAAAAAAANGQESAVDRLKDVNEQLQDLLMYISDVLEREVPGLGEALAERILLYALFPVAVRAILNRPHSSDTADSSEEVGRDLRDARPSDSSVKANGRAEPLELSLPCALFVLHQVLDTFRCGRGGELLLRPLLTALLRPSVPTALQRCCRQVPWPPPSTYKATNPDVSGPTSTEMAVGTGSKASPRGDASPRNCSASSPKSAEANSRHRQSSWSRCSPGADEGAAIDSDGPNAIVGLMDFSNPGAVVENQVRRKLLDCLQDADDSNVLLAAGVLSACYRDRGAILQELAADHLHAPEQEVASPSASGDADASDLEAFVGTWLYGENSQSHYRVRQTEDNVFHLTERLQSGSYLCGMLRTKEDHAEVDIYDDGSDVQVGVLRLRKLSDRAVASSFRRVPEDEWSDERTAYRDADDGTSPRLGAGLVLGQRMAGHPLEVLLLLLQALQQASTLRLVTIQVLVRSAVELANVMPAGVCQAWGSVEAFARKAAQAAARLVQSHLHGSFADAFLDIFDAEWCPQTEPLSHVAQVCAHHRCILPSTCGASSPADVAGSDWLFPPHESERLNAAKALQTLLHVRWLQTALQTCAETQQDDMTLRKTAAQCPVKVGKELLNGFQEGKALELGQQACIVCWVVTPAGPCHTRYLVLHQHLLLLVQPDPIAPGLALVKTLCPLQLVEATIEGEQRMLCVLMRLARGVPSPGEAERVKDANSPLPTFKVVLSFEDVNRCLFANQHIQKVRREVRSKVREQVETFINGLATLAV